MSVTATATVAFNGPAILQKIASAAVAGLNAGAQAFQADAKAYAPVLTGALRDGITVEEATQDGATATASVVSTVDYGGYVEFGTGRRGAQGADPGPFPYDTDWPGMVAEPYLRPAIDSSQTAIRDAISGAISDAL